MVKIAFDIGGVLGKYPELLRPIYMALLRSSDIEVFVLTDNMDHQKVLAILEPNGFPCDPERLLCADYGKHGEACKALLFVERGIDVMIDDYLAYVSAGCPLRLLVMPDTTRPYVAEQWDVGLDQS